MERRVSAGYALQKALVELLSGDERLTGIHDGPPPRAAFPYVAIDCSNEGDWSHKSGKGREVLVALTLWDDQPARLGELADAVEPLAAGLGLVDGWQLVTMRLLRRRTVRTASGPWATAIDYRARLLAV
jgi:uncharacterized protein DUF3168